MSIEHINRKNSVRYRAVVRIGRKKISKTFLRKIDANQWIAEMRASKTKLATEEDVPDMTLDSLMVRFCSEYSRVRNATSTNIMNGSLYRNYLKSHFGAENLKSLTSGRVDVYFLHLRTDKKVSNGRINRVRQLLHTMFNRAVAWGLIPTNPISRLQKLPERDYYSPDQIRFLSEEESKRLLGWLQVNDSWLYPKVVVMIHTGMRYGEMAALRVQDIRMTAANPHILISRSRCRHSGVFGPPKGKRARPVPLSQGLAAFLSARLSNKKLEDPVLWADWNESRWPTKAYDHFCKAIKESGVSRITMHDLRHCYAVRFLENGGHIYALKEILGHRDIKTTMRYSHFSPAMAEQARGIVDFELPSPQLAVVDGGLL